jgi:hypothetical protein
MSSDTFMILMGIGLNALTTIGGGIAFLLRVENRITALETKVDERTKRR